MSFKYYLIEIFEPTILFGMFSSILGVTAASHYGPVNAVMGILAVIGIVMCQMAINLIDDYEDYSSGLDRETKMTKFSGGSPLIAKKLINVKYVLWIGLVIFAITALIGLYLISNNSLLVPFVIVGGITILFYAKFLVKVPFLAEPLTALNFTLVPAGAFIAAGGSLANLNFFAFAAVPVGIQVGITVLLNYMPDRVPDKKYGRRSIGIMVDSNRHIGTIYLFAEALSFFVVLVGVAFRTIPWTCLIVLITLPSVLKISEGVYRYKNPKSFEGVMGRAVLAEFAFIILMAIAFA